MIDQKEQLAWEKQAYGMSKAELNRMVKEQAFPGTELMFAAGLLSDAQESISEEWNPDGVDAVTANKARQLMNCAKAIIFQQMDRKEAA